MSDPQLERGTEALDAGKPEQALAAVEGRTDPDAHLLATWALIDLGELASARERYDAAREGLGVENVDVIWLGAELALRGWDVEGAKRGFEQLVAATGAPAFLDRLSLCLELEEDWTAAEALLERASRADPTGSPLPARFDEAAFDAVVAQAVQDLAPRFREALDQCRVVVEPMPFRDLIDDEHPEWVPPDLLGLFHGLTLEELSEGDGGELPSSIYLFQRNLERACVDREALAEEIRITLYHELGHFLGLDEDEVDAMGLG
ncbi:MAG: metallopeptidase family protein [Planctomycetota bacterium]|nr:metallopeptidase family protein [Planctomycetota bacterium]